MKTILIIGALTWIGALSAGAAPFGGAHCALITSSGTSTLGLHLGESRAGGTLSFVPEEIFLASGAGIKLFTQENFYGDGLYLNEVAPRALIVDGGVTIKLAETIAAPWHFLSFACVDAGSPFPGRSSRAYFNYWNDKTFVLDRSVSTYNGQISVAVTYLEGRKLVTVIDQRDGMGTNTFVMDVDSYALSLTHQGTHSVWTKTLTATNEPHLTNDEQLAYIGAVALMRHAVTLVFHNKTNTVAEKRAAIVPNLELEKVMAIVNWQDYLW